MTTLVILAIFILPACHAPSGAPDAATDSPAAKRRALPMFKRNPEFRAQVKKEPVDEYRVRTDNSLNEMYFSVRLYETPATMKYLVKMEFEGITGEDTIKLPDMGTPPHPVLQKGPEKYSCIIGLLDNAKNFRELKKVYVTDKGQELKITTLKHYMVTEDYRLVNQ
ncbi:hypothetical protein Q4E93_12375 [Flavitalea sp. BT771]|uniref:hypothetical protein n=1 Tax=Flavitalea sp. BT771 TaxID=3063329 RepID=UPI0026E46E08|nr:hypothetical protein [Flavitalea sp. BT771]MDO6431391.1 hypothetical protein [Flavitalea sp. BT771]MDV6220299.1 hypothetical protein [Flavitalea sp. BT771]